MISDKKSNDLIKLYKKEKAKYEETEELQHLVNATTALNDFLKLVEARK